MWLLCPRLLDCTSMNHKCVTVMYFIPVVMSFAAILTVAARKPAVEMCFWVEVLSALLYLKELYAQFSWLNFREKNPPHLAMCRTSGATTFQVEGSCSLESCSLAGLAVRSCWCIRISSCSLCSVLYLVSPFEQGASWVMFVPKGALCRSPAAMCVKGQRWQRCAKLIIMIKDKVCI